MALKLQVVITSTRPSRKGHLVGQWFAEFAKQHGNFEVELVDLAEVNLPLFNEFNHPVMGKYEHDYTIRWSETVKRADAYIFVTPEYNYCAPPSFFNALNYLSKEWAYKPCGFVSYGGVSGGLRAVQSAKLLVTTLKMMPMSEGVALPNYTNQIADNAFNADDRNELGARTLLDEIEKWALALKPMRNA